MATIKSYTSLEQSKKLAKILSFESVDMCYERREFTSNTPSTVEYNCMPTFKSNAVTYKAIPCWSLASLLGILPKIQGSKPAIALDDNYVTYPHMSGLHTKADNLVDACVAMIESLHELKML